jgi:DHA3 family macrolide efflux protein-like MFS transporter
MLAFASIIAMLPQVLISPFAGALIDRWDRKSVLIAVDAINAFAVVVLGALFAWGIALPWHVFAVMFVRATMGAFQWPAMQASTALMVEENMLSKVAGLNQALMGVSAIVAPPLGVLLMEFLPLHRVLWMDVTTAMMAIVPLLLFHIPRPITEARTSKTVIDDLKEGFSFIRNWTGLLIVMGVAMVFNLLVVPAISLTPILVTEHFAGDSMSYAVIEAAMGIGMVAGGILLGVWGGFKSKITTALLGAVGMGVGTGIIGLAPSNMYYLAVVGMGMAGVMSTITNGSFFALIQSTVPPEIQGRVISILLSGTAAMAPIGLAIAGPLADLLGVRIWFLAGGLLIVIMGSAGFLVPAVMNMEKLDSLQ